MKPSGEKSLNSANRETLRTRLLLSRPFRVTGNDFDLVCRDTRVLSLLELERDLLDQKGPDLITEAVRVQMAL